MKRIVIFAHYDAKSQIDDYVVRYLRELKKYVSDIIFVSDCNLDEKEISKISGLTSHNLCKKHGIANDFGSFKLGFALFLEEYRSCLNKFDELLFVNDSCYCLGSFEKIFADMEKVDCDTWALNDHYLENDCYLQTNFFVVRKNVFTKKYFADFFASIKKVNSKDDIVTKYEIGLSKLMNKHNARFYIYYGYRKLVQYLDKNYDQALEEIKQIIGEEDQLEEITARLFNKDRKVLVGGDYAYSDHFYTFIKLGSPLVKSLALVINKETGEDNYLVQYWHSVISLLLSKGDADMVRDHISRVGRISRDVLCNTFIPQDIKKDRQFYSSDKSNRIALFAHYDPKGNISEYVIDYLRKLKKVADKIIFTSDCLVKESELAKIKDLIFDYTFEKHGEYDFGSYKRAFRLIKKKYQKELDEAKEIIIANDSCYCIGGFELIFANMKYVDCDVWSLGDDFENYKNYFYYLQSYFIVFRKNVFEEKFFFDFFESIEKIRDKNKIIFQYEIGLSKLMQANNKKLYAYFGAQKVFGEVVHNRIKFRKDLELLITNSGFYKGKVDLIMKDLFDFMTLNYVHSNKYYFLIKVGFPLIKRAIIYKNVSTFNDELLTFAWRNILKYEGYSKYIKIIEKHFEELGLKPKSKSNIFWNQSLFSKILTSVRNLFRLKSLFYLKKRGGRVFIIKLLKFPIYHSKFKVWTRPN